MMFFNKNLNYLVGISRVSKQNIANDLNISRAKLTSYLNDSHPRLDVLITISEYFNVTLDDFLKVDLEARNKANLKVDLEKIATIGKHTKQPNIENLAISNENYLSIDAIIDAKIEQKLRDLLGKH